jgi:hypothetical protein
MTLHSLQHAPFDRPGSIAAWAEGRFDHCRNNVEPPGAIVQRPQRILAEERRLAEAHQFLAPLLGELAGLS